MNDGQMEHKECNSGKIWIYISVTGHIVVWMWYFVHSKKGNEPSL